MTISISSASAAEVDRPRAPSSPDWLALLTQAEALYCLGLPPLPVCRPLPGGGCSAGWHDHVIEPKTLGKRPLLKGYPVFATNPPPWVKLYDEFHRARPCNLGIVLPPTVAVVEADSPEAEQEVAELAGDAILQAPCRERRPGRGRGWLFTVDAGADLTRRVRQGASEGIDILLRGGIFIVPPSVHASGHQYTWVAGRHPSEALPIPMPPRLLKLACAPAEHASAASVPSVPGDFQPAMSPRLEQLLCSRLEIARLWRGEGNEQGDSSQSGIDFKLAMKLLAARMPPEEVVNALGLRPGVHRRTEEYCRRTVQKAIQIIEKKK